MIKRKIYLLLTGMVLVMLKSSAQQTIQFSQYVFNGLAVNPAYAGYKDDWTVNLSSRLQWVGINGAPQTETASIDGIANSWNSNVGIGLIGTVDRLGPENMSSVYANYAYRLRLDAEDTKRISFGIGFGVKQYSLNGSEFNATDAADGSIPAGTVSKVSPDFRFGVYYYTPNFYVGASVFNLLAKPLVNITNNAPIVNEVKTIYLTSGAMVPLSDFMDLKPSFMIKEDFKGPTNLDLTAFLVFNKIVWLGTSYQTGFISFNKANLQSSLNETDAISAIAQFYLNDHFRVGYSYDFTLSKLASYQSGSHEISLSLTFGRRKQRIVSPRYF
ncbi:PorP/SprF family type IX secretion system membrane protein [Mucilaginibacter gotjawali]|uniref:Type IX secretion system PorP/SprF family membrane protein n=1 Tax=Mucilaginibacter gotjawali TaxID=1550579 RepID=A0A839SND2_9SPHI|nr:type IX secretion system membrane protein PorP/SprF [Mucilaginibacter gotjawali]MBB3059132.1 type IX secretion system PorP/SprF family membrane protein [Mucilaginibacter gotjawali]